MRSPIFGGRCTHSTRWKALSQKYGGCTWSACCIGRRQSPVRQGRCRLSAMDGYGFWDGCVTASEPPDLSRRSTVDRRRDGDGCWFRARSAAGRWGFGGVDAMVAVAICRRRSRRMCVTEAFARGVGVLRTRAPPRRGRAAWLLRISTLRVTGGHVRWAPSGSVACW
jgi:hypothetical protein